MAVNFDKIAPLCNLISQTLETVFDHISKHLKVRQKYSAARRIFNFLLGVLVKHGLLSLIHYNETLTAEELCHCSTR